MAKTYNDALEWAAKWIEDTLKAGPETDQRTIEFGTNMAMTLRAAKLSSADLPRATADARKLAREIIGNVNNYAEDNGELSISAFGPLAERIAAALATPRATGETTVEAWQPIETAPKDGRKFLAYDSEKGGVWRVYWDEAKWHPSIPTLTHWMRMPAPPRMAQVHATTRTAGSVKDEEVS